MSRTLLLTTVVIMVLSYHLYTPLPDNVPQPWQLQCCLALVRLASDLASLSDYFGFTTGMESSRLIQARAFSLLSKPVDSAGLTITNTVMEGVPVRMYTPTEVKDDVQFPVIVYFHGGGFVTFSVDTYDNVLREISLQTRTIIVAPEYRLAPEHPFPAALNDCYGVTVHVLRNAAGFHGDQARVAVAGDSAGGNLAAAVAWKLSNTPNLPKLPLQILLYPMLQAFNFKLPSYTLTEAIVENTASRTAFASMLYAYCMGAFIDPAPLLENNHTSVKMKKSLQALYVNLSIDGNGLDDNDKDSKNEIPELFQQCITNPEFSPLMAPDCSVFPKTYILSAEYDTLRDESFLFQKRLAEAGVTVQNDFVAGGWHGVVSFTRINLGQTTLSDVAQFINRNL